MFVHNYIRQKLLFLLERFSHLLFSVQEVLIISFSGNYSTSTLINAVNTCDTYRGDYTTEERHLRYENEERTWSEESRRKNFCNPFHKTDNWLRNATHIGYLIALIWNKIICLCITCATAVDLLNKAVGYKWDYTCLRNVDNLYYTLRSEVSTGHKIHETLSSSNNKSNNRFHRRKPNARIIR